MVWAPSDSEDMSSEEIDVGSDQNWLLEHGPSGIEQDMECGEEDVSSCVSETVVESDVCDVHESGQETSEGGGEESVRSGEGEVWSKEEGIDPSLGEDIVTDTVSLEVCVCVCVCVHAVGRKQCVCVWYSK